MKKILFTLLGIITLLNAIPRNANAQSKIADTSALKAGTLHALSTRDYFDFKKAITPLIKKMGANKIVGLGEGTHGTAGFYKIRFWISRILIEEYGFNHIALENDLSDSWLLNKQLNTNANLNVLMKKRLLSIWQNEETKEMLTWVKAYNSKHSHKVIIDGLDYVFLNNDVEMVKQILGKTATRAILDSLSVIAKAAAWQDEAWEGMNRKDYKTDYKQMEHSSYAAYITADELEKKIGTINLTTELKAACHRSLENIKEGFAPFYDEFAKAPEATRDSLMAYNAGLILHDTGGKMIIWAHNAHMAKKGIYNNEVGGTGGYISKMFPGGYFALGTGTATGTFAATKESRDTYTNPMAAYPLEVPEKNSWEAYFSQTGLPSFYLYPAEFNPRNTNKALRFIGYGPDSSPATSDQTNLTDLFDAFIFIKNTHAATPLK